MIRVAILTVSDKSARVEREDLGGPAIRAALAGPDIEFVDYRVVPDERGGVGTGGPRQREILEVQAD